MNIETYLMTVAVAVSSRATCRKQVGCVLADERGIILATGYNGTPRGTPNCSLKTCTNLPDKPGPCMVIHAEINALMRCADIDKIYYVVVTHLPCTSCALALLNTNGRVLVFAKPNSYPESMRLLLTKFEAIPVTL